MSLLVRILLFVSWIPLRVDSVFTIPVILLTYAMISYLRSLAR